MVHNHVLGGAGGLGGNGGNGLGGGIYEDALSPRFTLTGDTIDKNHAVGGAAGAGGSDGQGIGGGLYCTGGWRAQTWRPVVAHNHASTGDDDVFGVLCFISTTRHRAEKAVES